MPEPWALPCRGAATPSRRCSRRSGGWRPAETRTGGQLEQAAGRRVHRTVTTSSSTTGRNGSWVAATAATASRTSALRSWSASPATKLRQ